MKKYLLDVELNTLAGDDDSPILGPYPFPPPYDPPPDECGVDALLQYPRGLTLLLWAR